MHAWIARCVLGLGVLTAAIVLAGCTSDGHFRFLGYTTEPPYDPSIRTVYVSMAKNITFRQEMEDYLTRAVIREINLKTPMRTVSNRDCADTELTLKLVNWHKTVLIPSPTGQNRQAELGWGVEVVWKDLRPGHIGDVLSNAKSALPTQPPLPGMEQSPPRPAIPVLLLPTVTYEPELGPSNATAEQQAIDRVAVQVAAMMERPW